MSDSEDGSIFIVTDQDIGTTTASLVEGKVPASELPSYVDDVKDGYYYNSKFYEEAGHTTEITPEADKIYIDLHTNKTYRWSGTAYAMVGGDDPPVPVAPSTSSSASGKPADAKLTGDALALKADANHTHHLEAIDASGSSFWEGAVLKVSGGSVTPFRVSGSALLKMDVNGDTIVAATAGDDYTAPATLGIRAFDSSMAYCGSGDLVTSGDTLYRNTVDHCGAWDSSHFEMVYPVVTPSSGSVVVGTGKKVDIGGVFSIESHVGSCGAPDYALLSGRAMPSVTLHDGIVDVESTGVVVKGPLSCGSSGSYVTVEEGATLYLRGELGVSGGGQISFYYGGKEAELSVTSSGLYVSGDVQFHGDTGFSGVSVVSCGMKVVGSDGITFETSGLGRYASIGWAYGDSLDVAGVVNFVSGKAMFFEDVDFGGAVNFISGVLDLGFSGSVSVYPGRDFVLNNTYSGNVGPAGAGVFQGMVPVSYSGTTYYVPAFTFSG